MSYHFNEIEAKWQEYWAEKQTFKAENFSDKPKYYVLDMFPYPSGAGLHVGHPLGYIASDIYARYKRHKGFNVLHPQGYDSFGLPAEQYAIQTGQHPALTTAQNIKTYRRQLDQIGFSFDWSREVRTSDPAYYKWTQWIFIQLFNSWYDKDQDKAQAIEKLVALFEQSGNGKINAEVDENIEPFTAPEWAGFSSEEQQEILLKYRLTYLSETEVNWCPALGTVLANDEIVNGVSERGGHPVVRKKMKQWSMRISAYAERLLQGLEHIDWPQPLKDSQTYWIGKSEGAHVTFKVQDSTFKIAVFTTRPDTIFGVSFMTLAPEHELVDQIVTDEQRDAVNAYVEATAKRSERDRMADVKTISGVFTGAYAEHPFSKKPIAIWIGDYVLASYGTGAVMSVPCGDQRDYDFAKHFGIEIPNIFEGVDISTEAFADKDQTIIANSDFLNGMSYKKATKRAIYELEQIGQGQGKINYRLRDAVFSRQRYWGEPFPVYYVKGLPKMIDTKHLPIVLPEVEKYLPTEDGKPPLGNAEIWAWDTDQSAVVSRQLIDGEKVFPLELNTMPGWAGSSQYFNRYMDPQNEDAIFSKKAIDYWQDVDLYIGGSEHATGHLLYSRFWQKFMFDRGWVPKDEFAKKLINQGMITGTSAYVKQVLGTIGLPPVFVSSNFKYDSLDAIHEKLELIHINFTKEPYKKFTIDLITIHSDVSFVNSSDELDIGAFRNWRPEYKNAIFIGEKGTINTGLPLTPSEGGGTRPAYQTANPDLYLVLQDRAKEMRKNPTKAEAVLWKELKNKNLGDKFRRQHPIYNYIVDFVCIDKRLIIEVDGKIHDHQLVEDAERQFLLEEKKAFKVIRFSNDEVLNNIDEVISEIISELDSLSDGDGRGEAVSFQGEGEAKEQNWNDTFVVTREVEKMSKSKYNVVNPDDICTQYGADSLRLYEMFLGPLEQSKPWNTAGITGVHGFLKKLWKLYHSGENGAFFVSNAPPSEGLGEASRESLKTLHKTIKKVEEDIENFSFNTSVSTFMIAVNELTAQKCQSSSILSQLVILISPYAPHIAEELWQKLGNSNSISTAEFPIFDPSFLIESTKNYPISFNGKMRFTMELSLDLDKEGIEAAVMANEKTISQLAGRTPKKVIVVPGKIVNIVG